MCLQFHLLLCGEEVLLLQLSVYPTLGLEERGGNEARRDSGKVGTNSDSLLFY